MIRKVEVENFRCLRSVSCPLSNFHILVGPNASGKSTFLDTITFLSDLMMSSEGLKEAIGKRTSNFPDLLWMHRGKSFIIRVHFEISKSLQQKRIEAGVPAYQIVKYEIEIGVNDTLQPLILSERVSLWPERGGKGKTVINKVNGKDSFTHEFGKGWNPYFTLGPQQSALFNTPEDPSLFPVATWLKRRIRVGIQQIMLNSRKMSMASPPNQPKTFQPDGANLPWVIESLLVDYPDKYRQWIDQVQTALPDIMGVRVIDRPDDRHRYIMVQYAGNLEVPSWMVSDGTLRLLALTLPPFLPGFEDIYLVEEPENGIHPRAIETVFQALSSVNNAQVILATHSPVFLGVADVPQLLCFSRTSDEGTHIVSGAEHPALQGWKKHLDVPSLFAAGVLE